MPHLAVARFWFEGNRYSPRPTALVDFQRREWQAGPAAFDAARGTAIVVLLDQGVLTDARNAV